MKRYLPILALLLCAACSAQEAPIAPNCDSAQELSDRLHSRLMPYWIAAHQIENDEYRKLVAGADAFAHDPRTRQFLYELVGRTGKPPLAMEEAATRIGELDLAAEVAGEDREAFLNRLPKIVAFVRRITTIKDAI